MQINHKASYVWDASNNQNETDTSKIPPQYSKNSCVNISPFTPLTGWVHVEAQNIGAFSVQPVTHTPSRLGLLRITGDHPH